LLNLKTKPFTGTIHIHQQKLTISMDEAKKLFIGEKKALEAKAIPGKTSQEIESEARTNAFADKFERTDFSSHLTVSEIKGRYTRTDELEASWSIGVQ
jgi:hypothetical protein